MKKLLLALTIATTTGYPVVSMAQGFLDSLKDGISNVFDMSKTRLEIYKQAADKPLLDQFYYLSEDGKQQSVSKQLSDATNKFELVGATNSSVTLRQIMYREGNMATINQAMNSYNYDPTEDAVSMRYISFANERGNIIRLYKPSLNAKLNRVLKQNFKLNHDRNTSEWLDTDNALIEYNIEGKVISALTRSHQAVINIGATSHQYINIYFGKSISQFIENNITNADLANSFIRVVGSESINNKSVSTQNFTEDIGAKLVPQLPSTPQRSNPPTLFTIEQKIKMLNNLNDLRKAGALSDAEFEIEKKKLLSNQ